MENTVTPDLTLPDETSSINEKNALSELSTVTPDSTPPEDKLTSNINKNTLPELSIAATAETAAVLLQNPHKESEETVSTLPLPVTEKETHIIYCINSFQSFKESKKLELLEVVELIKKLRKEGKITYATLPDGGYEVTMPCDGGKMTMEFSANTKIIGDRVSEGLGETMVFFIEKNGGIVKDEEEGEVLIEGIPSEKRFTSLIYSLFPKWPTQTQIFAFMLATGFDGDLALLNEEWKPTLAVKCDLLGYRHIYEMRCDHDKSRVIKSTFMG